jgi:hypothetical protein
VAAFVNVAASKYRRRVRVADRNEAAVTLKHFAAFGAWPLRALRIRRACDNDKVLKCERMPAAPLT